MKNYRMTLKGLMEFGIYKNSFFKNKIQIFFFSSIHGLRIWSLSSNFNFLNVHIVAQNAKFYHNILEEAIKTTKLYGVQEATIQIEVKAVRNQNISQRIVEEKFLL
jgi:hypothetical protein